MTPLEQNRAALLTWASDGVPAHEQDQWQQLLDSDPECRAYWDELQLTIGSLNWDAAESAEASLPTDFHEEVMSRLAEEAPAVSGNRSGSVREFVSSFWVKPLGLTEPSKDTPLWQQLVVPVGGFAAVAILAAFLYWPTATHPPTTGQVATLPLTESAITPSIEEISWAALRTQDNNTAPLQLAATPRSKTKNHPTMSWADRDRWVEQFDL